MRMTRTIAPNRSPYRRLLHLLRPTGSQDRDPQEEQWNRSACGSFTKTHRLLITQSRSTNAPPSRRRLLSGSEYNERHGTPWSQLSKYSGAIRRTIVRDGNPARQQIPYVISGTVRLIESHAAVDTKSRSVPVTGAVGAFPAKFWWGLRSTSASVPVKYETTVGVNSVQPAQLAWGGRGFILPKGQLSLGQGPCPC